MAVRPFWHRFSFGRIIVTEATIMVETVVMVTLPAPRWTRATVGLGDAEPPARIELFVGDQVEHVQPGEREPLGLRRARRRSPRAGALSATLRRASLAPPRRGRRRRGRRAAR